ncbi:OmpP1/FadL family transporter [Endothiovibrio diazotrophicus]
MKTMHRSIVSLMVASALAAAPAISQATDGMNLNGFGPISTAMGGASMAYDNGTAAMMNNPATLALAADGNRLDVALGFLGPDVVATNGFGQSVHSGGDAYYMPAIGWTRKSGNLSYGVGMYSQGGMGTEYGSFTAADGWMSFTGASMGATGLPQRSEVGVGRILVPLAYNVSDKLTVGGSLDYIWVGMDIKMNMAGSQFRDLMTPAAFGGQTIGSASGAGVQTFGNFLSTSLGGAGGPITDINYARFDFSDGSDFSGKAKGQGFGGKIGLTYKVNDKLTVGAAYHTETDVDDLETSDNVSMSMNVVGMAPAGAATDMTLLGKVTVHDFQWPATVAIGAAYQFSDRLMLAADLKRLNWSNVMGSFDLTFTPRNNAGMLGALNGQNFDVTLFQKWDDQTILQLGGQYKLTDAFTLRAGASFSSNPIPDAYLNPLFPAIIEKHLDLGFGYQLTDASSIDFSYTRAFSVDQTNSTPAMMGISTTHHQDSWQAMYSYRF